MKLRPHHHPLCRWTPKHRCTCGLDALRAKLIDREKRIRLARENLRPAYEVPYRVWDLLSLRKPLSLRTKRTK